MALAMFEMFEMSWRGVNLSTVSGSSENKNVCVYIYIYYVFLLQTGIRMDCGLMMCLTHSQKLLTPTLLLSIIEHGRLNKSIVQYGPLLI